MSVYFGAIQLRCVDCILSDRRGSSVYFAKWTKRL